MMDNLVSSASSLVATVLYNIYREQGLFLRFFFVSLIQDEEKNDVKENRNDIFLLKKRAVQLNSQNSIQTHFFFTHYLIEL